MYCCYTILLLSPTLSTNCKKKNRQKKAVSIIKHYVNILNVNLKTQLYKSCGNLGYD